MGGISGQRRLASGFTVVSSLPDELAGDMAAAEGKSPVGVEEATPMELGIKRLSSGAVEISPLGRLDEKNLTELRTKLLDHAPTMAQRVLLDLSGVDHVDTAAMALLMLARIEIEARGGAFVVDSPRQAVKRAMERAGLPRFVAITERRIDALRAVRPEAVAA